MNNESETPRAGVSLPRRRFLQAGAAAAGSALSLSAARAFADEPEKPTEEAAETPELHPRHQEHDSDS